MFGQDKVKKKKKQESAPQKKEKKFGYKEEENDWMVSFNLKELITTKMK